jgi:hypothetical protein
MQIKISFTFLYFLFTGLGKLGIDCCSVRCICFSLAIRAFVYILRFEYSGG